MIQGGCLCGGVRFEISGRPTPIQLCHARRCQRFTGSAFAPELAAPRDGFRWLEGESLLTTYEAPLLREPPPLRRAFCRVCGSPMPVPMEGTDWILLLAGVLDEDPGVRPFRRILLEQNAAWYEVPQDALQRFDGRPPPEARLPRRSRP